MSDMGDEILISLLKGFATIIGITVVLMAIGIAAYYIL